MSVYKYQLRKTAYIYIILKSKQLIQLIHNFFGTGNLTLALGENVCG